MLASYRIFARSCRNARYFSTTEKTLREVLEAQIPKKQAALKELKLKYGNKSLGEVTVDQCINGSRDIKSMYYETSLLDPLEGIRFRNYSIPELQKLLPSFAGAAGAGQPIPEGMLWLLLTGQIPTKSQCTAVTQELHARSTLPKHVYKIISSLPKEMHPMTQLSIGMMSMQTDSVFAKAYSEGANKAEYWKFALEDILNLIARVPELAAVIYRRSFHDGIVTKDTKLDYSGNFCRMLGYNKPEFDELMRMYLVIHADHEGGNASAHTAHLVGSTLADPYLSMAAGNNALAGPLHGLANQEVLKWIMDLRDKFQREGKSVTKTTIEEFAWETLKSGKVIPGYGHAVLRRTDPRYMCQREFALKYMPNDPLFQIVSTIFEVVPDVLTKHGKTKNPWPNVDSHSGVLLWHYGLREWNFYTVLFGVSRTMGAMSQLFWDRALALPLERPKSVTPEWIEKQFKDGASVAKDE